MNSHFVPTVRLNVPEEFFEMLARRAAEIIESERRFMSRSALAAHLGVGERRIMTLREYGLPARKVGRELYFDLNEVNEWLDREGR